MSFWSCNIDRRGRLLRFSSGVILLVAAIIFYRQGQHGLGWMLGSVALFTFFEAARGWCVLRAAGFKTRY